MPWQALSSFLCESLSLGKWQGVQWNPDFSSYDFFEPPDNSYQKSFPSPESNTVILPQFLELYDFSNQFSFPLEIQKVRIPLYYYSYSPWQVNPQHFLGFLNRSNSKVVRGTGSQVVSSAAVFWDVTQKRCMTSQKTAAEETTSQ